MPLFNRISAEEEPFIEDSSVSPHTYHEYFVDHRLMGNRLLSLADCLTVAVSRLYRAWDIWFFTFSFAFRSFMDEPFGRYPVIYSFGIPVLLFVRIVRCLLSSERVVTGECMTQIMWCCMNINFGKSTIFVKNIFYTINRKSISVFIDKERIAFRSQCRTVV